MPTSTTSGKGKRKSEEPEPSQGKRLISCEGCRRRKSELQRGRRSSRSAVTR
ncbi:hypothetical protein BCR35DRAFT_306958 [Leucosporidium creatinivorum]|uniref:Uncharacterized protein n=1 Tax=Leucosporidium creatinivorum TaxID=106004 RepID=A0A1Y2EQN1_9BASI|nr:hypothetical protein BCR35DRAFT_306958 [Leucosporidium creatinivorum]